MPKKYSLNYCILTSNYKKLKFKRREQVINKVLELVKNNLIEPVFAIKIITNLYNNEIDSIKQIIDLNFDKNIIIMSYKYKTLIILIKLIEKYGFKYRPKDVEGFIQWIDTDSRIKLFKQIKHICILFDLKKCYTKGKNIFHLLSSRLINKISISINFLLISEGMSLLRYNT